MYVTQLVAECLEFINSVVLPENVARICDMNSAGQ